jgi:hypothetical protein
VAKKRKTKAAKGVMPGALEIDFSAPAEMRVAKKTKEMVSSYTLDDGSVIHVRPSLVDVRRSTTQYNEQGQPIYLVKFGLAITTTVPKRLYKGARKTKKKKR